MQVCGTYNNGANSGKMKSPFIEKFLVSFICSRSTRKSHIKLILEVYTHDVFRGWGKTLTRS